MEQAQHSICYIRDLTMSFPTICFCSILVLASLAFAVVRWEKRTLSCVSDTCVLSVNGEKSQPAECRASNGTHSCDISCIGADRDSVISKTPSNNRPCVRFHTYNTMLSSGRWSIWRNKDCAKQTIELEVHCGYPIIE